MGWKNILKERQPGWANDEEKWELREQMQRREDKAASYDKPTYSDDHEFHLSLESVTKSGWDMPDLDEQEFFTGTLEEAKKWAEEKFDYYADSNEQFRNYGSSAFKLYDEEDNLVHSSDNY